MTAAKRYTPTVGNGAPRDGTSVLIAVDAEIEALWKTVPTWLINVGGTGNAVTATSDTALVAAIAAYARPMSFYYQPVNANTGAVTINIDTVGVADIKDQSGNVLQGGEFVVGGRYQIAFDGTIFCALGVTAGAANRPATMPDVLIQEQQSSGTYSHAGATFTSGAYRQRVLNTSVRDNIGASLASNQITLPAGTYYARWRCPANGVGEQKTRLYNATDSSVLGYSASCYAPNVSYTEGSAIFTLTASKAIEIDHRCTTTQADGFGMPCSFGDVEIYSEIMIWKQ